jgi:hypothetical protein
MANEPRPTNGRPEKSGKKSAQRINVHETSLKIPAQDRLRDCVDTGERTRRTKKRGFDDPRPPVKNHSNYEEYEP